MSATPMSSPALTLFSDSQFTSPYVLSVFVALTEKKLPFTLKIVDLSRAEHLQPGYRAHSLTARVPSLAHGDFQLSESSAIDEYIDEAFPASAGFAPLYPGSVTERARARELQAWLRSDFMPIRSERSTATVFCSRSAVGDLAPLSVEAQAAAAKLFAAVEQLLPQGATQLFGEWCIADTDLTVMLMRLVINGEAVPERVKAYALQQWQRPSLQAWVNLAC